MGDARMTKHTQRDKLRAAIRDAATEAARSTSYGNRFGKSDVRERLNFNPSDRSLRDTMNTMVEQGIINESSWQGEFEPGEVSVRAAFPLFFEGNGDETAQEAFERRKEHLLEKHGFVVLETREIDNDRLLVEVRGEFGVQKGKSPTEMVAKQVSNVVRQISPDPTDVDIEAVF